MPHWQDDELLYGIRSWAAQQLNLPTDVVEPLQMLDEMDGDIVVLDGLRCDGCCWFVGLVEFKKMGKRTRSCTWQAICKKDVPKTPSKKSFNGFRQVKLETVNQWMTCLRVNWSPFVFWGTKVIVLGKRICLCELPKPCGQGLLDILAARSTKGPLAVNSFRFQRVFEMTKSQIGTVDSCDPAPVDGFFHHFLNVSANQKVQISPESFVFFPERYVSIIYGKVSANDVFSFSVGGNWRYTWPVPHTMVVYYHLPALKA